MRQAWVQPAMVAVLLSATTLLAYGSVLVLGFTHADTIPLIVGSRLRSLADLGSILGRPLMTGRMLNADFFRPLTSLSYAIDEWIFGVDPFGFHLTDLILHGANGILLFFLVRRVTALARGVEPAQAAGRLGRDVAAAAVAFLFLLHPIQVEFVAAPARRADLLCGLFLLLALQLTATALSRGAPGPLSAAAAMCFAGLAAKETGIIIPLSALLLVLVAAPGAAWSGAALAFTVRRTWPFALATLAFLVWRTWVLGGLGGYHGATPVQRSLLLSLGTMLTAWVSPLRLTPLVPTQLFARAFPWFEMGVLASLVVMAALQVRRKERDLRVLILLLVGVAAAVLIFGLGRVPAQPRHLYVPAMFLSAAVVGASALAWRGWGGPSWLRVPLRAASGSWILTILAASPVLGPRLNLNGGMAAWKHSSDITKLVLEQARAKISQLPPRTLIFLVNTPYCVGAGCYSPRASILLEHSVQGFLDLEFPDRNYDVVGVSHVLITEPSLFQVKTRFDAESRLLRSELAGSRAQLSPWGTAYSRGHVHTSGLRHHDFFQPVDSTGASIQFLSPRKDLQLAFFVYLGDRVEVLPWSSWEIDGPAK